MVFDMQNLGDLLALARLLRHHADESRQESTRDQLLSTARALEERAFSMVLEPCSEGIASQLDAALHAPVNLTV
jgi:hypothetical protein